MKKKTTTELLNILANEKNIKNYIKDNKDELEAKALYEELERLLEKYKLTKAEVIKRSNLQSGYGYQIFNGTKENPSRDKLLALCIAMKINFDEVQKVLTLAQCGILYPRNIRDSIIINAVNKGTGLQKLNQLLSDMDMDVLE